MNISTKNVSASGCPLFFSGEHEEGIAHGTASLRFPEGGRPVFFNFASPRERAFALRYLSDIQFLVDGAPDAWTGWETRIEEESCPVLDFDPEWFSFLLPAKEETRMELFAWYWLWAEPNRRLTLSRYACNELGGAFDTAARLAGCSGELDAFIREINAGLNSGCIDFREHLIDPEAEAELRVRLEMGTLWFPGLIVDFEPFEAVRAIGRHRPDLAVWVYLVSGAEDLYHVVGQVRAVRIAGSWKLEPRAVRTYRAAGEVRAAENRSALHE